MKTTSLVSLASVICSGLAFAADADPTAKQLQVYPKNLARQHVGSNLFVFSAATQTYVPTEAAAAWLDDDVATGWPVMAGKQHYLLALSEPELLTNFSVSARTATGTVNLYAGDEPAAPGAKSWAPLAKNISFETINNQKLAHPFSRFAKYLLIETDVADPGPLFSLYVYGEKPAVSYDLRQREQAIDSRAIFGQYVNNQTTFNVDGLYAHSRVAYANSPDGFLSWQKAIDDNPESALTIDGSTNQSGAVIEYGETRSISRISVLTSNAPKGKIDFFAVSAPSEPATGARTVSAVSVEGLTPTVSMVLDGSSPRASMDFPPVEASALVVRWSPVVPSEKLALGEIDTFSGLTLADNEVGLKPEAVAEFGNLEAATGDGKDFKDLVDPKKNPEPVALGPNGSPYLPGSLGFPPNLSKRVASPPPEPVSP